MNVRKPIYKVFRKEIAQMMSFAITSFHYVDVDTRDKMVELACDMLTLGQIEALAKRAGMTKDEYIESRSLIG